MKVLYLLLVLLSCVIAMLFTKRRDITIPFICGLILLPDGVNLSAGPINIWGVDILCVLAFIVVIMRAGREFKAIWGDILLLLPGLWYGLGLLIAHGANMSDLLQASIRWIGPWWLPYLIARIGTTHWSGVKRTLSIFCVLAGVISFLAMLEALTEVNLLVAAGIIPASRERDPKFGLFRPSVTFNSLHILGMFLATMVVLSLGTRKAGGQRQSRWSFLFLIISLGTFFSTSATGIMQAILGVLILLFYPLRRYWAIPFSIFVGWSCFVQLISNRSVFHWYAGHMVGLGDAYYRADLMVYLPRMMPGHWLFGYGLEPVMPMWYARYEDICNQWLFNLARGGLPCLLFLVAFFLYLLFRLRCCYGMIRGFPGERVFVWTILSIEVSIVFAFFFIALFGSDIAIFSYLLGLFVSLPDLARRAIDDREICHRATYAPSALNDESFDQGDQCRKGLSKE